MPQLESIYMPGSYAYQLTDHFEQEAQYLLDGPVERENALVKVSSRGVHLSKPVSNVLMFMLFALCYAAMCTSCLALLNNVKLRL